MKAINFGALPDKSTGTYPAFWDFECEHCDCAIFENDPFGYVTGAKVCEPCWEDA